MFFFMDNMISMNRMRAVQKLIEMLKTPEQIALVISSLRQGVVTLIKDLNGNHVVQRCLQRLSMEDSQVLLCIPNYNVLPIS
jgi:SH3-like domain-containing protein